MDREYTPAHFEAAEAVYDRMQQGEPMNVTAELDQAYAEGRDQQQ